MKSHAQFKAYLALLSVSFFWGTTYLAIRMALESFPPLLLVSTRFLLSGSILLAVAVARGAAIPRGRGLLNASGGGVLILGLGNGALVFAERLIPSGLAGLFITISPFWLVGLEALVPGGEALHWPAVCGMLVGLAGAGMLVVPGAIGQHLDKSVLHGFLILQLGMACWSLGSILQKRQTVAAHPIVVGAVHQLAAGLAFLPLAFLIREQPVVWNVRGAGALIYLVIFGSIVGYSSYVYALDKLPVAIVSIYPYLNAVVAVGLGWLVYREPFGITEAIAMAVIFGGVALVKRYTPARGHSFSKTLAPTAPPATQNTVTTPNIRNRNVK
ncbi:MAG: EamA family transporter [Bryobacteraceae bacterium]